MKKKVVFFAFAFLCITLHAQIADSSVFIRHIVINGNKITRGAVIDRELVFNIGDSCKQWQAAAQKSRENLLNTNLFNDVTIHLNNDTAIINVTERWYWWPNLFVMSEDPDVNIWVRHPKLNRLSYGITLENINFRGRKEILQLGFKTGFNESAFLFYSVPFINRERKVGLQVAAGLSRSREMFVDSRNNSMVYFSNNSKTLEKGLYTDITLTYRPAYRFVVKLRSSFDFSQIADTVLFSNPQYQSSPTLQFGSVNIIFQNDQRDHRAYPLQGYFIQGEINISSGSFSNKNLYKHIYAAANFKKLFKISKLLYSAHSVEGRYGFDRQNWFYDYSRPTGITKNVRGYELYYFPGSSYWLSRQQLKVLLLNNQKVKLPLIRMSQFNPAPLYVSFNVFSDIGKWYAVYKFTENSMSDKSQISVGAGIDLSTYYNKIIRVEYVLNKEGKKGLYLQFVNVF